MFAAGVGLSICVTVTLANLIKIGTTCSETSGCAHAAQKDGVYQGVLTDSQTGTPLRDTAAALYVESLDREIGKFRTDSDGGYCFVWANESVYPVARLGATDERLRTEWHELEGAPPPTGCQTYEAEIPWDRANGVDERPWPRLIYALAGLGALLLVAGLAARRRALGVAGLGIAAASAVAFFVAWG
jgi:hypothetical protein